MRTRGRQPTLIVAPRSPGRNDLCETEERVLCPGPALAGANTGEEMKKVVSGGPVAG